MKICLISFHFSHNFGGLLQMFALGHILKKTGHQVTVLDRKWGEFPLPPKNASRFRFFSPGQWYGKWVTLRAFDQFTARWLPPLTPAITNQQQLQQIGGAFDMVIVGSDQIWNSEIIPTMGLFYFLDFVPDHVKRLAYAVSFGKDTFEISSQTKQNIAAELKKFCAISVREEAGIGICRDIWPDADPELTLDPTLLLEAADYHQIAPRSCSPGQDYVCVYLLDPSPEKKQIVADAEAYFHCSSRKIGKVYDSLRIPVLKQLLHFYHCSFRTWLSRIRDARFVVTDSFHGTVFAIIFHKDFICIDNPQRGSSRFQSLLSRFGLSERLISADSPLSPDILARQINYESVEKELCMYRKKSLDFLVRNIK